jgi:hypothetical protein
MPAFAKFNPATTSGEAYDAIDRIVIETPPNGDPAITLVTARRIEIAGDTHTLSRGNKAEPIISAQPTDDDPPVNLTETFNLLDPTTGAATGATMAYGEAMSVVYSMIAHIMDKP